MKEEQEPIKAFRLKTDLKSFEKPKDALKFSNAWVTVKAATEHVEPVTAEMVLSSITISKLMKILEDSSTVFDWRPDSIEWNSQRLSNVLRKGSQWEAKLMEAERALLACCPALEEFYIRSLIHIRPLEKGENRTVYPLCTWCGNLSQTKGKCRTCGQRVRFLGTQGLSCYEAFFDEQYKIIEHCQDVAQSSIENVEWFSGEQVLNDTVNRMNSIQRQALELSKNCDAKTFNAEMKNCISRCKGLEFFKEGKSVKWPRKLPKAPASGLIKKLVHTYDLNEKGISIPFSDKSIRYFSSDLFEEYSRLRESFCVNYVLNNAQGSKSTNNRIKVLDVVDGGDNISLHCELEYQRDTLVSYQEVEISSVNCMTAPKILVNTAIESINACFVGRSGSLVLLKQIKVSDEVGIYVAVPGQEVVHHVISVMPKVITYLDGTSQLLGAVYKVKEPGDHQDWTQQIIKVYSFPSSSSRVQQFDLPLFDTNMKWAVADVTKIQFIPSAQKLTALDKNRIFHVWDWYSLQLEWQVEMDQEFDLYSFSPDGKCLFFSKRRMTKV